MSKIPPSPEKRNKPGIGRYRDRLHNRARHLCEDEGFRKGLVEARRKWNEGLSQKQQRYQVVPVAEIADIQDRGVLTSLWKSVDWQDPDALHPVLSGPALSPAIPFPTQMGED